MTRRDTASAAELRAAMLTYMAAVKREVADASRGRYRPPAGCTHDRDGNPVPYVPKPGAKQRRGKKRLQLTNQERFL